MSATRSCPLCNSNEYSVVFDRTIEDFEGATFDKRIVVVCCNKCGFAFNIPSITSSDQHYANESLYVETGFGVGGTTPADATRYLRYHRLLKPFLPMKDMRIADIGCSKGGFLAFLKSNEYSNLCGVEVNPRCAEYARTTHGLHVVNGTANSLPFAEGEIDVAVYSNVFEHLDNPAHAVNEANRVVKDNGIVFVEVPNASRYVDAKVYDFFYWFGLREHINHFDLGHLAILMEQGGFELIASDEAIMAPYEAPDPTNTKLTFPLLCMIFRKSGRRSHLSNYNPSGVSEALRRYVASEITIIASHKQKIKMLIENQQPVYVWGIGLEFFCAYSFGDLKQYNIQLLLDRNPVKHMKTLNGLQIASPETLITVPSNAAVVITSSFHRNEMLKYLKEIDFKGDVLYFS